jgi:5'-3' exonuclease/20S proteasome alpha/beta subunit
VCYYLERIIGDMVQPKELVYMAIDGVAPRAKMNQQRCRRYRSGREGEIETNIYEAHALALKEGGILLDQEEEEETAIVQQLFDRKRNEDKSFTFQLDVNEGNIPSLSSSLETEEQRAPDCSSGSGSMHSKISPHTDLEEIAPGRFKGKFETHLEEEVVDNHTFHSSAITPGTPFFAEFTRHLEHFVKFKLSTDPKWKDLTIIFSGPNVPGEGEHKIMQFIREQRNRPDYNPNLRHCIMGQDGDLIMLGLCTHEPNLLLLRERVMFNAIQLRLEEVTDASMLDLYIHNAHFEFLHMGVLRDYLAYEFETSDVISDSPWDLERTIDDFVFMTFLVGNDFLPHLPAIDIADNAFDLLFWTYKKWRKKWVNKYAAENLPYLTCAGKIVSGKMLETFLSGVGNHENAYYDKKRQSAESESKRLRKHYKKLGIGDSSLPDKSLVASKEAADRAAYRKMLQDMGDSAIEKHETSRGHSNKESSSESFLPVMTGTVEFEPVEDDIEEGIVSKMGSLLRNSLSSSTRNEDATKYQLVDIDDQDLKGRYYYDKFQFTPFDAEKHLALRRAYMEGLVWTLSYYYEGCVSWEWYYPYHYGPMLSDLVNLDEILDDITFRDKGAPFTPFEQLLGCMPPSQAHHIPAPYRWLMTDPQSPIIDFYPKTFTIDMNGKRWPWEAVVLLPFIDSKRLLEAVATVDQALLSNEERERNSEGTALVIKHDSVLENVLPGIGDLLCFQEIGACKAVSVPLGSSQWRNESDINAVLLPVVKQGTEYPLPGFASLRSAPVQSLWRRKMGLNIFGGRSRYKTATLEISFLMPPLPPVELLGPKLIGTTVFINYPHFVEALVTAVSDQSITVRGKKEPRMWTHDERSHWQFQRDGMIRQAEIGDGRTGTGGLVLPSDESITLSVRPLQGLSKTKCGTVVKSYARFEIEIPLISTLWSPAQPDPRLVYVSSHLEKNAFEVGLKGGPPDRSRHEPGSKEDSRSKRRKLFPKKIEGSTRGSCSDARALLKISTAHYSTCFSSAFPSREPEFEWTKRFPCLNSRTCIPFQLIATPGLGTRDLVPLHTASLSSPMRLISKQQAMEKLTPPRRLHFGLTSSRVFGSRGHFMATTLVVVSLLFRIVDSANSKSASLQLPNFLLPLEASHAKTLRVSLLNVFCVGDPEKAAIHSNLLIHKPAPKLEFAHGTTTLSFSFKRGIIVAVDSRSSIGNFVGSKTVQKVLPISSHVLGTMAGGAADCQYWIRKVKSHALLHELKGDGTRMSVSRISRILSNYFYHYRHMQLSIGTMIAGWDSSGPQIYYVDNTGLRIEGDLFSVGSGSAFALGILDTHESRHYLSVDEAIALGIKAIRHATFRDAYSGGFINVYLITPDEGWKKVYTEDIARSPEVLRSLYTRKERDDGVEK